jgi:hypothetical protein
MADVITLSRDFPDLLVEAENKSLRDLGASTWACKKSAEHKKINLFEKAFARGQERDINSVNETVAQISIHGKNKSKIVEFKSMVKKCADQFGGKMIEEDNNSNPDSPEDGYRFFAYVDYIFRG